MPQQYYNRQVRPVASGGQDISSAISAGNTIASMYNKVSNLGETISDTGRYIQRKRDIADSEAEQTQYHAQSNQAQLEWLKEESSFEDWKAQNPKTETWEPELKRRHTEAKNRIFSVLTNKRAQDDWGIRSEAESVTDLSKLKSGIREKNTKDSIGILNLSRNTFADKAVSAVNEEDYQDKINRYANLHGFERNPDKPSEWRSIKDYHNLAFDNDEERRLLFEKGLGDIDEKRGRYLTDVKKQAVQNEFLDAQGNAQNIIETTEGSKEDKIKAAQKYILAVSSAKGTNIGPDHKRQLIEHANGYANALFNAKEKQNEADTLKIGGLLNDLGSGKTDYKNANSIIADIGESGLGNKEKKTYADSVYKELSEGDPKTDPTKANKLTNDLYTVIAEGGDPTKMQVAILNARFKDRSISQADYSKINGLVKKGYTPVMGQSLKESFRYGQAKISDPKRLSQYNGAMQEFIDQHIEKGDLTVSMIQQQSVILASMYYPSNYQTFGSQPQPDRPKITPFATADKELNEETVNLLRREAGGDEYGAMKLARERGYTWELPRRGGNFRADGTEK